MLTCCCCDFADRFNRSNGSVGSQWTAVSGTWAIAGNKLQCSTSSGLIIWNEDNSRGDEYATMSANVFFSAANATVIRLILGYSDSDNYIALQVVTGTGGHVSIVERITGVETEYEGKYFNIAAVSPELEIRATYAPAGDGSYVDFLGGVSAKSIADTVLPIESLNLDIHRRLTTFTAGKKSGVEVSGATGNVDFDEFGFPYCVLLDGTDPVCFDYELLHCGGALAGTSSMMRTTLTTSPYTTDTANGHTVNVFRWPHNRGEPRYTAGSTYGLVPPAYAELYVDWNSNTDYHYVKVEFDSPVVGSGGFYYSDATITCYRGGTLLATDTINVIAGSPISGAAAGLGLLWEIEDDSHVVTATFNSVSGPVDVVLSFTSTPFANPASAATKGWSAHAVDSGFIDDVVVDAITLHGIGDPASPYDDADCL